MTVTIAGGGKYAIRSLTSAGTTTVTVGSAVFVSGDFGATQRMVCLYTAANALKGIAWVRRFISTTQLELENQFVDPVTGLYATQAINDQVLVSKDASECAATGFAVSIPNNTVTVTDNILMGTAGSEVSLAFYQENMQFTLTNGFTFNGGVSVFGKLLSYDGVSKESFVWSRECTVRPNESYPAGGGTPAYNIWGTGGTSAHMFFFGGALGAPMRRSFFIGAQGTGATNKSFAFFGSRMYYACASPSNGANWASAPERHLLYKTLHEADYSNANLIVWGNGAFQGSFLSFPQSGAGTPLGIFRASGAASFGAAPNNRTIVADLGTGALIDDVNNGGPYTFTNTITPAVSVVRFSGGTVPASFQFSDTYTNLKPRSTVALVRGDGTLAASVVNTASSDYTPTVLQAVYAATANGVATPTEFYTTFNWGVFCYGYQVVSGTHSSYTYPLGTAGNGTNLKLGGLVNQVIDQGVTLTESAALALSSKFSINPTTKVITVLANATYDEGYDYTVAWKCSSEVNAQIPNLQQYLLTYSGARLSAPAGWTIVVNTGVTYSAGSKFNYIYAPTITLNGTGKITGLYGTSTGDSSTLRLQNVSPVASVCVWHPGTGVTELFQSNVSLTATFYEIYYPPGSVGLVKNYARELYASQRASGTVTLVAGLNTVSFVDIPDVGISQQNLTTVQAYTTLENLDKFYDATAAFRLGEQGIKFGQIVTREGTSLNIGTFSHVINHNASAVYSITGSVITTKSSAYEVGVKYNKEIATPPATVTAHTNEIITVSIEDANGNSQAVVAGTVGSLVDVWKITNSTPVADFATGVKIASDIGNGAYRFIGTAGFKLVFNNKDNGVYRYCSMSKGDYTVGWYLYDSPTGGLTQEQSDTLNSVSAKNAAVFDDINKIMSGFVQSTDSLHSLSTAIADSAGASAVAVWSATSRTLTSTSSGGATLAEIEASTVLAMKDHVLTRLAAADYTAPDNASIIAAKDNSDLIPILLAK